MNDKTTATASRTVLVERAYALGITVPKSWNKHKIETAIAQAEVAADVDPAASVEAEVEKIEAELVDEMEARLAAEEAKTTEKAPETPAEAPSTAGQASSKGTSSATPAKPEFAIETTHEGGTRVYDVVARSDRSVTLRLRPQTEKEMSRKEREGWVRVGRQTVQDADAPVQRLRIRQDGTYRMWAELPEFEFTHREPAAFTDYRV